MPEITIGPEDPHFIHHNDITGVKLVGNLFEGTGFGNWKRSMLIALSAKNKLGFVDGTIRKPASTAATAKFWQRCNDIVFSWILNSVSPEIADSILYSNTAEEAWVELEERFGQSNGAQLYGVQKKLNDFAQGNDSIVTYYTKLKSIWDEIDGMGMNPSCSCGCTCGAKVKQSKFQEDKRVVQFLMGLNDSYAVIRGTILLQNPLPKISIVYNNLLQEERQREIHNSVQVQVDSAALYARNPSYTKNNSSGFQKNSGFQKGSSSNSGFYNNSGFNNNGPKNNFPGQNKNGVHYNQNNGFNNGFKGKNFNQDKTNDPGDKPTMFCNYCKRYGHVVDNCRHLQNRNRRFAGNAAYQGQNGGFGIHGNNSTPINTGNDQMNGSISGQYQASTSAGDPSDVPCSSANFAGLFHEALDTW